MRVQVAPQQLMLSRTALETGSQVRRTRTDVVYGIRFYYREAGGIVRLGRGGRQRRIRHVRLGNHQAVIPRRLHVTQAILRQSGALGLMHAFADVRQIACRNTHEDFVDGISGRYSADRICGIRFMRQRPDFGGHAPTGGTVDRVYRAPYVTAQRIKNFICDRRISAGKKDLWAYWSALVFSAEFCSDTFVLCIMRPVVRLRRNRVRRRQLKYAVFRTRSGP